MLHIVDHPLVHDVLLDLRDQRTDAARFRDLAERMTLLLGAEALRDLPAADAVVETPLGPAAGRRLRARVVFVPVLRAGLGMLPAMLRLVPAARVGYIGLQRDEATALASQYYTKLPEALDQSQVVLLDPMLATGGSAVAALDLLSRAGARAMRLVCIVAAQAGVDAVRKAFPDVAIYTPVVDPELNARKFIVPGLGDFGDRLYGTT
ncbi:MAG: uracil phosphoribosyltransferase [Acidobacteriota bacterium]